MNRFAFFSVLATLPLSGCSCGDSHDASHDDGGITFMDTGPRPDTGPGIDSGPRPDTGTGPVDSGPPRPDTGPVPSVCGNSDLERGEQCDDGNTMDGDGCDSMCQREAYCGDGTMDAGEVCDDGNNASGDGCRSDCLSDESCGNGIRDVVAGEICDDMMVAGGCSDDCMTLAGCGNMMVDPGETCDDGNATPYDGCGADCLTETSVVVNSLEIGAASVGCDYSGDGSPDNRFGDAFGGGRSFINDQLQMQIDDGGMILLGSFLGLDDPSGADDDSLRVAFLNGIDADTDPTNNLGGMGRFYADMMALGPDGLPLASLESRIAARMLDGGPEDISFVLPLGGAMAPLDLRQAYVTATTRATMGVLSNLDDGVLCGVIPIGSLAMVPNPAGMAPGGTTEGCDGSGDSTLADLLVGGATIIIVTIGPASPDVDLDGDGLESFEVDEAGPPDPCQPVISACIDGDGTRIEGHDCVFDPRIRDGFSAALPFTAVHATIVGAM